MSLSPSRLGVTRIDDGPGQGRNGCGCFVESWRNAPRVVLSYSTPLPSSICNVFLVQRPWGIWGYVLRWYAHLAKALYSLHRNTFHFRGIVSIWNNRSVKFVYILAQKGGDWRAFALYEKLCCQRPLSANVWDIQSLFNCGKKTISPPISFYDNFRVRIAWWTDTGQSRSILSGLIKSLSGKLEAVSTIFVWTRTQKFCSL